MTVTTSKKDLLIGALIIAVATLCFFLWRGQRETPESVLINEFKKTNKKIDGINIPPSITYKGKDSVVHLKTIEVRTEKLKDAISKEHYDFVKDTLSKSLDVSIDKITELSRINARLEGELKATKIALNDQKKKVTEYKDKYIKVTTTEDSIGSSMTYLYDAKLDVVHYTKKNNWFGNRIEYIDISSPDKNFKVNGLENYKKEIKVSPNRFGIGFNAGYGFTLTSDNSLRMSPYLGFGLSYNLIKF